MPRNQKKPFKAGQAVWNLKPLFSGDNDPRIEGKRKLVEKKSTAFINAWKDRTDYLEDPGDPAAGAGPV